MKFRIRKRKRATAAQANTVQRPPQVITVNTIELDRNHNGHNNHDDRRWALQKLFASHLFKISRKHLGDNPPPSHHLIRRRTSLADASTAGDSSVVRPQDPFLEPIKPKPKPSFRITCGTNHSTTKHKTPTTPDRTGLRCTDRPVEEPPKQCDNYDQDDANRCSFWCPLLSFVPDSYSNDLRDSNDIPLFDPKPFGFFLLSNAFRKKSDTKRNGIPKVITVTLDPPGGRARHGCCGSADVMEEEDDIQKLNRKDRRSFDSSIFRLEEYLMRANLDRDVEDKLELVEDPVLDHLDRTLTSATSSISTHSSLKFGASIIHLPAAMKKVETK